MSIKKRSAANQAIVEMLKEQQQQNNDSLNSSTEKTESQKNLEKESKKEMEQYKNSKEYQRKESIKETAAHCDYTGPDFKAHIKIHNHADKNRIYENRV